MKCYQIIIITIYIVSATSLYAIADTDGPITTNSIQLRLESIKKCLAVKSYIENEIDQISNDLESYDEEKILILINLSSLLAQYTKIEPMIDPLDSSYQQEFDIFVKESERIVPSIFKFKSSKKITNIVDMFSPNKQLPNEDDNIPFPYTPLTPPVPNKQPPIDNTTSPHTPPPPRLDIR